MNPGNAPFDWRSFVAMSTIFSVQCGAVMALVGFIEKNDQQRKDGECKKTLSI